MRQDLSEIVFVLDRSGSMYSLREDAMGGFNAFLAEQKKQPGQANLTLALFSDVYWLEHAAKPIAEVPPLDETIYVPSGTTALLDAVGRTIDSVGERLAGLGEADRPGQVIFAVMTDGLENASRDYTKDQVAYKVREQQEVYNWTFLFLGANMDAFAEAGALNIPVANALNYAATREGTQGAYSALSEAVTTARAGQGVDPAWNQGST